MAYFMDKGLIFMVNKIYKNTLDSISKGWNMEKEGISILREEFLKEIGS